MTSKSQMDEDVSRFSAIVVGVLLFGLTLPLVVMGAYVLTATDEPGAGMFLISGLLLAIGTALLMTAVRLIFNLRRPDGGLFSTFGLSMGVLMFAIMGVGAILFGIFERDLEIVFSGAMTLPTSLFVWRLIDKRKKPG